MIVTFPCHNKLANINCFDFGNKNIGATMLFINVRVLK